MEAHAALIQVKPENVPKTQLERSTHHQDTVALVSGVVLDAAALKR